MKNTLKTAFQIVFFSAFAGALVFVLWEFGSETLDTKGGNLIHPEDMKK